MPAVSRKDDAIRSPTGAGANCSSEKEVKVYEVNSNNVYVNSILAVNQGCLIEPHPLPGCIPIDESVLDDCSTRVFIGGKGVGRIDDKYSDNVIIQGSPNVFAG